MRATSRAAVRLVAPQLRTATRRAATVAPRASPLPTPAPAPRRAAPLRASSTMASDAPPADVAGNPLLEVRERERERVWV